jgi:hypothetical protein
LLKLCLVFRLFEIMFTFLAFLTFSLAGAHPYVDCPHAQIVMAQRFEDNFTLVNDPQEFLPGWTGNDVRNTSSRIFQSSQGRNGSKALAVQPISTFNGIITVRLKKEEWVNPSVQFWARAVQNSTGTRAAEVFYSWRPVGQANFGSPVILGGLKEFLNENQEFRKYRISIPEDFREEAELILKFEIRYGAGTGNAARWILDDFEYGDFVLDIIPPQVSLVRGYDEKVLEIIFNESLDPIFSLFTLNYEIKGIQLVKAELKNDSIVHLFSTVLFKQKEIYQLSVRQIPDLEGNFMKDTLVAFTFFDPTEIPMKGIVMNEIMPAPKSDLDLPNVEYVEIFNAHEQEFRLDELIWSNSKTSISFPSAWLAPGEYLILAPENQAGLLKAYGKVLPMKNWPSLLNSGDMLTITTLEGKKIDQLSYSTASWKGSEFANGGYSLEIVNPFYSCDQSSLLQVSKDPQRGTPGKVNSVFSQLIDQEIPVVNRAYFRNDASIILDFSRPIFPDLMANNFRIDPFLEIAEILFESTNRIHLRLKSSATPNLFYTLQFNEVVDCNGNKLPKNEKIELTLAVKAKIGDLVINEVLLNPKTGFPKFVELQNTTNSYLEVSAWRLANLDDRGAPGQLKSLGAENLQIPPKGFLVFTTNSALLQTAFPNADFKTFYNLNSLPSYPISGGNVVLLDDNEKVAEIFSYSPELHHPLLRDPKGVSLERISISTPVNVRANWHSASAIAGYGTPGQKNSQFISEEYDGNIIQIEPEVFDPEGSNGNTFTSIKYELDQAGWVGSFQVFSISGQLIISLANNELLGTKGLLTWSGTDSNGKIVRPGYYILMVELFDLSGQLKSIKKTIVVATRF